MHKSWRFLPYAIASPAMNMALDEAILIAHRRGHVPPTIRLYGWNPAALSFGYFQKAEREVDRRAVAAEKVELVRRLTGGRAVLHDQEITYSVIVKLDHPQVPSSVSASHQWIGQGLTLALQRLGLPIEASKPQRAQVHASLACFDAPSDYEIVLNGKKLVGSAQTRQQGVLLQHGSILLSSHVDRLVRMMNMRSEEMRDRIRQRFASKATALDEWLQPLPTHEELCSQLYSGLSDGLQIDYQWGKLTPEEQYLAKRLVREKYANDEWTLRR